MIPAPLRRGMETEAGLEELDATLREAAGRRARVLSVQKLRKGVYRIAVATAGHRLSVVAKRLTPPVAHRNQLALERWLPAAGLEHTAPKLLGVAAARTGGAVWHLYEDLGDSTLRESSSTRPEVEAAINLIATLHAQLAGSPVLVECRLWGMDHGMAFYDQSIKGAIAAVGAAITAAPPRSRHSTAVRALLKVLEDLADERDQRARALAEFGGTETLLHGDLWLQNIAVVSGSRAERPRRHTVRLIDWDSVGPGSFSYDLSTLIMRFPPDEQARILGLYRAAAGGFGVNIPAEEALHGLFTTAEYARLACDAIWPALDVALEGSRPRLEELAAFNDWFRAVPAAIGGVANNGQTFFSRSIPTRR